MANVKVTVLFLLAVLLLLQAAFCQTQNAEEFKLQISEKGTKFEETIVVDTVAQTEVFKVPAHNGNANADVMNDFKRRLTVYCIHDIKTCYVSRLQADEPYPQVLKESLKQVASRDKPLPVTVVSRQWIPKELFPAFLLGKEALNFCGSYPIYRVEQHSADAVMSIRNTQGGRSRKRRDIIGCKPGSSYNLSGCRSDEWLFSCKVATSVCTWRIVCKPDQEVKELCSDNHEYTSFVCCDPFCP